MVAQHTRRVCAAEPHTQHTPACAEANGKRDQGTCMMRGVISGSGSEMSTAAVDVGTSADAGAGAALIFSSPPPLAPPATPFQLRPSDPMSLARAPPRFHTSFCAIFSLARGSSLSRSYSGGILKAIRFDAIGDEGSVVEECGASNRGQHL